jgi:hypothetical protein
MGRISRAFLWLASCLLLVSGLAWFALQQAPLEASEVFLPPFQQDEIRVEGVQPPYRLHLELSPLTRLLMTPGGDRPKDQRASDAVLQIDGMVLEPAHLGWDELHDGAVSGWRHEARRILVRLPDAQATPSHLQVNYRLSLKRDVVLAVFWLWLLAVIVAFRRSWWPYASGQRALPTWALKLTLQVLALAVRVPALVAAVFLLLVGWAALLGWELPARYPFSGEHGRWLATVEPWLSFGVLAGALLGFLALRVVEGLQSGTSVQVNLFETAMARHWKVAIWWVAPAALLATAGATWAGVPRLHDMHGSAIAGLLPFNDAGGHYHYTFEQMRTGEYAPFVARRPLAGALRSWWMLLAGFSSQHFLQMQVLFLGLLVAWGSVSITRWRGVWAGLAYFALAYACLRPFASTHLTEPLGLAWALLAIPATVVALQSRHPLAISGMLAFTSFALLTRMGSLFTIPALALWAVWVLRPQGWRVALSAAIGGPAIAVCTSLAITAAFTDAGGGTGSNFSTVLCGLSHGGDWTTCLTRYAQEIEAKDLRTEREVSDFLYAKAFDHMQAHPQVIRTRLADGFFHFLENLPQRLLGGYRAVPAPGWFGVRYWPAIILLLLVVYGFRRARPSERGFWLLLVGSVMLSAPVVIFDDGWRALVASYPALGMLMALAFSTSAGPLEQRAGAGGIPFAAGVAGITLIGMLLAPLLNHHLDPLGLRDLDAPLAGEPADESIILGGRALSGIVVVPDDTAPSALHAVRWSDFVQMIEYAGVEAYQPLTAHLPPPPFAFVNGPVLTGPITFLVASERLVRDRTVEFWQLERRSVGPLSGPFWTAVEREGLMDRSGVGP